MSNGGPNEQEAAHGAVEARLVENAFSSREPSGCRSHGAALQQPECQPGGGSGCSLVVVSDQEQLMRTRSESLACFIAADQVRGCRQSLEVLGVEWRVSVGRFEQAVRVAPCPLLE